VHIPHSATSRHIQNHVERRQVYLKIGDVARLVGISPSAIRGWEASGLTRPHRTKSRYRLYTNDDVRLLKKARYLRKVRGLNAAAIVQMLKREGAIKPPARAPQQRLVLACAACAPSAVSASPKSPPPPASRWLSQRPRTLADERLRGHTPQASTLLPHQHP
jgi:DNA-binding transcriptional MerR regulator